MAKISIDNSQVDRIIELLKISNVPHPSVLESSEHKFDWTRDRRELANAYFAIVAICHQTSPIGERGLQGYVTGDTKLKKGWEYLKEKFLIAALQEPKWTSYQYWRELTPNDLSMLYQDERLAEGCKNKNQDTGKTLNRVNERVFFINDLGNRMAEYKCTYINEIFDHCGNILGGKSGFLRFLRNFEAYKDPVMKKSLFFSSLAKEECGWEVKDEENLFSPVDYHELRGHLRIGTLMIDNAELAFKVQHGLTITEKEDTQLREQAQKVNYRIGKEAKLSSSSVHYLFWNVFRNCCVRESAKTHCLDCGNDCKLHGKYKEMPTYKSCCIFSKFCRSSSKPDKVLDPAYMGHFY